MGQCPYVDNSASFIDGYHCTKIGGKVREYDITRCYCNSSASYEYCPHLGGDDRLRRKPDPEPEETPTRRTNPSYETEDEEETPAPSRGYGSGGGGGRSGGSRGGKPKMGCMGGLVVAMILVSLLFVLIMDWLGYNDTQIQIQLPDAVAAQGEDFSLRSICLNPEKLYDSKTEKFDETGFGRIFIEDGPHEIYLEHDGVSYLLGTLSGSGSTIYTVETSIVEQLLEETVRPLLITLENGAEETISPRNFQVTDSTGQALPVVVLGDGQYAVLSPEGALASTLTFRAEGYAPLTVAVNQDDRITGLLVTLAEIETVFGG